MLDADYHGTNQSSADRLWCHQCIRPSNFRATRVRQALNITIFLPLQKTCLCNEIVDIFIYHFPQLRRTPLRIPHHGQFHLLLPPHDSRLGPHRRPRSPHRHALRLRHTHDLFPAPGRFWRSLPLSRRPPDSHSRRRRPWDCGAVCGDGGVWDWMVDACLVDSYGNFSYGGEGAWNGGFGGGLGKFFFFLSLYPEYDEKTKQKNHTNQ